MIFDVFLGFVLPFFSMLVLTTITVKTLRKSAFGGLHGAQREKTLRATNRVTWMCVIVVIVYLLCQVGVFWLCECHSFCV